VQAKAEGEQKARTGFHHAKGEGHKTLRRAALEAMQARRDPPRERLRMRQVCGEVQRGGGPLERWQGRSIQERTFKRTAWPPATPSRPFLPLGF